MKEKIYIVPGGLNSYFLFINRLVHFGVLKPKHVSKENQVLIIAPEQLQGVRGKVFLLHDAALNSKFNEINLQLQLRSKVLKVYKSSELVTQKDFLSLI